MQPAPWARSAEVKAASGQIELQCLRRPTDGAPSTRRFVEKPWIENFATFASTRPQQAFIVARSHGTCTSESEANQQALDDARARLTEAHVAIAGQSRGPARPARRSRPADVLHGGFIVDRFAQSFEGSAGKIWRQAVLLDVSGPKLAQLAAVEVRRGPRKSARAGPGWGCPPSACSC